MAALDTQRVELAEVNFNFNDDDDDKYEALRGVNLKRLNEAKAVRSVHRRLAYRPINAIAKLVKEGYISNMPIDGRLLRSAEATLGKPCHRLKSRAAKKRTSRIKLYDRLIDGHLAIELDATMFYRRLFLVGCTRPHSRCKAAHLGPTASDATAQDSQSLMIAFEKTRLYYTARGWKTSYAVHDSQSGVATTPFQNFVKRRACDSWHIAINRRRLL